MRNNLIFFFESFSIYEIYNKICALLIVFGKSLKEKHFQIIKKLKNPPGRIEKISNIKTFIYSLIMLTHQTL